MISLIYKIFGDNSPFRKTVTQDMPADAAKGGAKAGEFFGSQFKTAILSYLGANAILGKIKELATEAAQIVKDATQADLGVEAFQEMRKAAELTGLSMDELRKKAIEAPKEFAELMESIRASGGIISKQDIENLKEVDDFMTSIKNKSAGLLASLIRGFKLLKFGQTYGAQDTQAGLRFASEVYDLPPFISEEGPKTPAQKFRDETKRVETNRKLAADAIGGLLVLGGVLDPYAASKAGIIPKPSDNSMATMDDAVKAIKELNAMVDKKL